VAAVLDELNCPSCEGSHNLCLDAADFFSMTGTYEFICPVTGQKAGVRPGKAANIVTNCPEGIVLAKRVHVPKP